MANRLCDLCDEYEAEFFVEDLGDICERCNSDFDEFVARQGGENR